MKVNKNKKKTQETVEEVVSKDVETTETEKDQLDDAKGVELANDEAINFALRIVSTRFNIGKDFTILGFKDGANSCAVKVGSSLFDIEVKIKDKEALGYVREK